MALDKELFGLLRESLIRSWGNIFAAGVIFCSRSPVPCSFTSNERFRCSAFCLHVQHFRRMRAHSAECGGGAGWGCIWVGVALILRSKAKKKWFWSWRSKSILAGERQMLRSIKINQWNSLGELKINQNQSMIFSHPCIYTQHYAV